MLNLRALGSVAWGGKNLVAVAAGILLLRRWRWAGALHAAFAALAIVGATATPPSLVLSILKANTGLRAALGLCSVAAHRLIDLAYPVFALIWFCRPSVRRQVKAWRTPAGRARAASVGVIWPTVLGIAAIVLGGAALLHVLANLLPSAVAVVAGEVNISYAGWYLVIPTTEALVLALPIVAGCLLLARRRAGVAWAIAYAIAACLHAAAMLGVSYLAMSRNLELSPSQTGIWILHMVSPALTRLVPPVLLLAWLARAKVRAEVRSWVAGQAGICHVGAGGERGAYPGPQGPGAK